MARGTAFNSLLRPLASVIEGGLFQASSLSPFRLVELQPSCSEATQSSIRSTSNSTAGPSTQSHARLRHDLPAQCLRSSGTRGFFSVVAPAAKKYNQRRLIGWSPDQLYSVVADVDNYHHFVPWCQKSRVVRRISPSLMEAELQVGFQMFVESYVSRVTLDAPRMVRSQVSKSLLFHHLNNTWVIQPGPSPGTCWLTFEVDFAFNSVIYSQLADLFFDQVVKRMVAAFEGRCEKLYGPSSLVRAPAARKT